MSLKGIGWEKLKLYLRYHYEEHIECYDYSCMGDYNEELNEYEFHCEECEYKHVIPAHDETYVYSGVSKEEYEELRELWMDRDEEKWECE